MKKKIIEIRFLTKSVGINAEKKILNYSENISSDTIIIFRLPELKAADFRKKFLGIKNDNVGLIRIYPMTKKNMVEELTYLVQKNKYNIIESV